MLLKPATHPLYISFCSLIYDFFYWEASANYNWLMFMLFTFVQLFHLSATDSNSWTFKMYSSILLQCGLSHISLTHAGLSQQSLLRQNSFTVVLGWITLHLSWVNQILSNSLQKPSFKIGKQKINKSNHIEDSI